MPLPDLSAYEILFLALAAITAGLVRGFSGFGAAMTFLPVASIILTPAVAIPVLWFVDLLPSIALLRNAWKNGSAKTVLPAVAGYGLIVFPAAYILATGDSVALRWLLSGTVFVLLGALVAGYRYRREPQPGISFAVGGIAGFLGGSAGIGGPPMLIYWLSGPDHGARIRANIIYFFALSTVFSGIAFWQNGLLTRESLFIAAAITPVYALAIFAGARLFGKSSDGNYRMVAYAVIFLAAAIGLPVFDPFLK